MTAEERQRGWHPDPHDPSKRAFWDGKRWRRTGVSAEPARPVGQDWWKVVLALVAAFALVSLLVALWPSF